ncbi:MAG: hypothetical protein NT075_36080 [Chloroflexi bacterium]|nr:hypothetical protein [Chloroflexota bacterium]
MKSQRKTPRHRRSSSLLLASIITICAMIAPRSVQAQASPDGQTAQPKVYLPLVAGGQASVRESSWQPNAQEQAVEALFRADPEQRRQNVTRNDILSSVARARAEDMAAKNYFSHTSPDGHGPNYWVSQAGYALPSYYVADGNNIESIGLNYSSADLVWDAWKHSAGHRVHVLAEEDFYVTQTDYGIGYAVSSNGSYWVLITAQH